MLDGPELTAVCVSPPQDYLAHIIDQCDLSIRPEQVCSLFGNIEDIYEFNRWLSDQWSSAGVCSSRTSRTNRRLKVQITSVIVFLFWCNFLLQILHSSLCFIHKLILTFKVQNFIDKLIWQLHLLDWWCHYTCCQHRSIWLLNIIRLFPLIDWTKSQKNKSVLF